MKPSPKAGVNIHAMMKVRPTSPGIRHILAVLCLPILTVAADAQRPEGAALPQMAERLEKMADHLNLSADQRAKIKSIMEKSGPEIREIMAKGRQNASESDREKVRALLKKQTEEIGTVLTEDQRKKFAEAREKRLAPPALEERLEKMTKTLSLTPEQQAKVKTILANSATETRELFSNARETKSEADREKMASIIKKQFEEIGAILEPDQKSKLRSLRQERERPPGTPQPEKEKN
jgi:Spy/CpxP family protein refolding chaperone